MTTKTPPKGWMLSLLSAFFLLSGLTACSSSSDEIEDSTGFEQIPYSNPVIAKDFKQSDLEAFLEYAIYTENLRMQFYQISSNGWNGEFFGGIGDKSDAARYFDYLSMILQNADKYAAAIDNLDWTGVLTTTTTSRGVIGKLKTAIYGYGDDAQIKKDEVLDRLNALHVMGNADLQRQFYNALEIDRGIDPRGGHKNAQEFFKSLYAGELNHLIYKIDYTWQHVAATESFGGGLSDYYDMANDQYKGPGNQYYQEAYKTSSKVATSAGELYISGVDKISGGYGSTIVDGLEEVKDNYELAKKTLKGELTGKDVKEYVVGKMTGKVKDALGDVLGDDIGSDIVNAVVEEAEEQVTELIVDGNEEAAEKNDASVVEVNGEDNGVKTTFIVDEGNGTINIGFPNKDEKTVITTNPGKKKITTTTSGGERVTQEKDVKKGKTEIKAVPLQEVASVSLSQSVVEFEAEGGSATIEVYSNCPYCRISGDDGEWYKVKRNGKVVTVTVGKNDTDVPRKDSFTIEVSQDGKKVDTKTTVTVKQAEGKKVEGKISATPSSLEFEAGGGEKTVQLKVEGMEYFSGYVEGDDDSWITVTNAPNTSLLIKVAANDTGKERSGIVYAFATNVKEPTQKDVIQTPIVITQKGDGETFTITPNPVRFNAQGGEVTVTVVGEGVKSIKEVDFHSLKWIGGSGMGLTAVISAQANETDKERQADFDITVEMNDGTFAKQHFVAYQDAGTGSAANVGDIESIDFYVNVAEDESGYSGSYKNHGTLNSTEGTIKTTRKGDGLHVECAQQIDYIRTTLAKIYDITVSFDIDDVNGIASKTAKIMNLKYHSNVQVTYYIDSEVSGRGTDEEAIEVTNIPMSGASTWIGTSAGGVKFSNFVNKGHVDWVDMSPTTYNYTYVEDPANEVQVTIHFK